MKKIFLLILTAIILLPSLIHAQMITVADGTATSSYLPIYGFMADVDQHSQMIYPANLLTALPDRPIYAISFYTTSSAVFSFANFTIKMGEVSATNFTSASFSTPPSTTVYSGTLTVANNRMTIALSNPYIYHGGNLMIDFSHIAGGLNDYYFQGISSTGCGVMKYSYYYPNIQNFLPKITFHCTPDQATDIYVATNGDDAAAGTSWETAKATIQAGCYAAGNGGTVFVKAGQYNTSSELDILNGMSVLGGFTPSSTGTDTTQRHLPGTNSHWDDASYCTIINGSRTHRIASIGEGALLEGCVLQNGTTNADGGGAFVDGGTLRYAVVRWCDAIHLEDGTATGGGVFIRNNGQLLNSVITECRADNGSAIAGENGIATNNTITRNWPANCGTVDDYDGNTYHTVIIGDQCWMRENLRSSHYADGGIIPRNTSGNRYASPYYFYYYYSDDLLVGYGYHYNWAAAMNGANSTNDVPSGVQGICPNGWHLPSRAEYEIMLNFVNSFARYRCNNTSLYLSKSLSANRDWNSYSSSVCYNGTNISSNNTTYFSAMPAGYYTSGSSATNRQTIAFFLTSTLESNSRAWSCRISYNDPNVTWDNLSYDYGYSIRCVKNQQ